MVPCFGFGNGSGILRLMTGNICQPCDSDAQCLGDAYLGYCNPKIQFNSTNENEKSYSQCVIRTLLASGSHLPSRQGKCQVSKDLKLYTGKYLSEALIFASINPQYDNRLFMELP